LRQDGYWSNRAADVLPLALANWRKRLVRIYSSEPHKSVIKVHPLSQYDQSRNPILLAYTVPIGHAAHYVTFLPTEAQGIVEQEGSTGESDTMKNNHHHIFKQLEIHQEKQQFS